MGAYHTLDLELNRKFVITKPEWDSIALERVEMACDPGQSADVAAVIMQDGIAHICLITPSMTIVKLKIDITIPKKRKGSTSQHEKVSQNFQFQNLPFQTVKIFVFKNRVSSASTTPSCKASSAI
jgi:protein pelota